MKIQYFVSALSFFLLLSLTSISLAQSENEILGLWYNTEKSAQIDIQKSNGEFTGTITWLDPEVSDPKTAKDVENSDPELRDRAILGMKILEGLTYSDGKWEDGTIYDPKSGKTYSCELNLLSKEVLEVKGYIGFSFIGRTVEWTKVKK